MCVEWSPNYLQKLKVSGFPLPLKRKQGKEIIEYDKYYLLKTPKRIREKNDGYQTKKRALLSKQTPRTGGKNYRVTKPLEYRA